MSAMAKIRRLRPRLAWIVEAKTKVRAFKHTTKAEINIRSTAVVV